MEKIPFATIMRLLNPRKVCRHTHVSLKVHDKELHEETMVVSRVETVPEREEEQRQHLTVHLRAKESEPLVDVLRAPVIGVYIERHDVMIELRGGLEPTQLHVRTAVPSYTTVLVLAVARQAERDAYLWNRAATNFTQIRSCFSHVDSWVAESVSFFFFFFFTPSDEF